MSQQGLGVVGVRVSVERHPRLGFTLTRHGGWFDILVNGGGAVTLQFQRNPYKPEMRTILATWNRIVVLDKVMLRLGDDGTSMSSLVRDWTENGIRSANSRSNNQSCNIEQLELIRPQLIQRDASDQCDSTNSQNSFLLADKQVTKSIYSNEDSFFLFKIDS